MGPLQVTTFISPISTLTPESIRPVFHLSIDTYWLNVFLFHMEAEGVQGETGKRPMLHILLSKGNRRISKCLHAEIATQLAFLLRYI
jgi:hypothetical protein